MDTILPPLATGVEYSHYRLRDTSAVPNINEIHVMYRLKSHIDG